MTCTVTSSKRRTFLENQTCLVGVHVALGARTGLKDNEWEVVDQLAGYYLPRRIR
jgi:hypothetical protein